MSKLPFLALASMTADETDLRPIVQLEIDRYGVLRSACLTDLVHLAALSSWGWNGDIGGIGRKGHSPLGPFFSVKGLVPGPLGGVLLSLQRLADVAGFRAAPVAPVCVPVRPVGAGRASGLPAHDLLLTVGDFARSLVLGELRRIPSLDQEAADEDEESPEVVLVERAKLTDKAAFYRHVLPAMLPKR